MNPLTIVTSQLIRIKSAVLTPALYYSLEKQRDYTTNKGLKLEYDR